MKTYKTLRKIGSYSLFMTVPPIVIQNWGLSEGDQVLWDIGEEEIRMKFIKATTNKTEAVKEQEDAVEAT